MFAIKYWDSICQHKRFGGLGFRKFEDINLALLAKLGWKIASGVESLWTTMLRKKYMKNGSFLGCKAKPGDSYGWRSILSAQGVVQAGACF